MKWTTLAFCLFLPSAASSATGVAFVHGTGAQTNAYDGYWTGEFIESVRQGLDDPNNLVVINCDFTQYMWTDPAAGCLATQLHDFIVARGIDDLVVNTHSNGGNVMRWILSNPTWDSRYPAIIDSIRWVNAIAPSSKGTPLADAVMNGNVFEKSLGWLLGAKNDAVRQQQVSWMAYYNENWLLGSEGRPNLPVRFFSVVGTDVESNVFDPDSYCGGYSQTLGLEITQEWLDECSDGFLDCSSQAGAGSVWFFDTWKTDRGEPLNHNQSRRKCFGLDTILRNDI